MVKGWFKREQNVIIFRVTISFGCEIEVYTNQMEEVAVVHKVY